MNLEPAPRLNKIPFFLTAAGLFGAMLLIGLFAPNKFATIPLTSAVVLLLLSITAIMIPILVEFVADTKEDSRVEREKVAEQVQRLHAAGESLMRAAAQIKAVEEAAAKTAHAAENLPYRMQEKLAEFNQQLTQNEDDEKDRLTEELAALRQSESERLHSVSEKIIQATNAWTALELASRQQLASAQAASLSSFDSKIATLTANLDAKVAETTTSLETKLNSASTSLEAKLASLDATLADKVTDVATAIDTQVQASLVTLESRFAALTTALDEKLTSLQTAAAATPVSLPAAPISAPVEPTLLPEPEPAQPALEVSPETASTPTPAIADAETSLTPAGDHPPADDPEEANKATPTAAPVAQGFPRLSKRERRQAKAAERAAAAAAAASQAPAAPTPAAETPESPVEELVLESRPAPTEKNIEPESAPTPAPVSVSVEPEPTLALEPEPAAVSAPIAANPALSAVDESSAPIAPDDFFDQLPVTRVPAPMPIEETAQELFEEPAEPIEAAASSDGATRLLATAYIGIGNKLFIRGEGPGLSWDKGVAMQFVSIGKWGWASHEATAPFRAKLYKNDDLASLSGEVEMLPGKHIEVTALF